MREDKIENLLRHFGSGRVCAVYEPSGAWGALVDEPDLEEFVETAGAVIRRTELREILCRALDFSINADAAKLEISYIALYAALESVLTFFRRQDEHKIIPSEEFARLERDLRGWLKQHPLLANQSAKRGLIYEKIRELNRFSFSYIFQNFCERHALDLCDLWPLVGSADEWPLMEIRHRLVHGDPFTSCPPEAMLCAREHLRWTTERMLLSVLGWPVARSGISREKLLRPGGHYHNWQAERARFG